MSIFASRTTKTIPIPFDPPHEVTVQRLAGRHLARAHEVWLGELYAGVKARGGAAVQKDMQALFTSDNKAETDEAVKAVQADPLNGLDVFTILTAGVKAWTYPEPVSPETLADLDDEAVTFIAHAIMRLTKPALFQDAEAAKASQREGDAAPSFTGR